VIVDVIGWLTFHVDEDSTFSYVTNQIITRLKEPNQFGDRASKSRHMLVAGLDDPQRANPRVHAAQRTPHDQKFSPLNVALDQSDTRKSM
jgi:hypothetical protein